MKQAADQKWTLVAQALVLAAFALRITQLDAESLWFDEATTARNLSLPFRQMISEAQSLGHLPYYILLQLLPDLESSEFSLRYPSVMFGVLGMAAMYAVGRRLLDTNAAVLAELLLLLSPMHIWYSRQARTYSLTCAVALLGVAAYLNIWQKPSRRAWAGLVAAQTLLIYAHLFAALANVWQTFCVLAVATRRRLPWRLRCWFLAQLAVAVLASPLLALAAWGTGQKGQLMWISPPTVVALLDLSLHLSGTKFLAQFPWAWILWLAWLALVAWGAISVRPKTRCPGQARLFLLSWALVPVNVLFAVSWTIRPLYVHRYLLFTLPAYVLLVAAGVFGCRRRVVVHVLAGIAVGIHVLSTWSLLTSPRYTRSDWRAAQQYLVAQVSSDDLVVFHPWLLVRPFDYYNRSPADLPESALETVGVPQEIEIVTDAQLLEEMDRIEQSFREAQRLRLWIVEHQSDVRASDWLELQDSWHRISVQRFDGGLLVGSYELRGGP